MGKLSDYWPIPPIRHGCCLNNLSPNPPSQQLAQPRLPRQGIYRVLVCRPNHRLGNMLLITPLIRELERLFKGVEIDIIAEGDIAADVFPHFFSVRNVFRLPRRGFKHPPTFLRVLKKMRATTYDLVIDPSVESGFARALTKAAKARHKLGFSDTPERSGLTHAVPLTMAGQHMAQRPINLLRWAVGDAAVAGPSSHYPSMDIRLTEQERAFGHATLLDLLDMPQRSAAVPVVGVFGNATGAKRYPESWWNEFIATFRELVPQAALVEILPAHGQSMLGGQHPGYYSSDIRRMGAVMAGLDLLVSADCGVMHLAVASRVPTVGFFRVTAATVYEPYGQGSCALVTGTLSASEVARKAVASFADLLGQSVAVEDGTSGHAQGNCALSP